MTIDLKTISRDHSTDIPNYLRHLAWRYANAQAVIYQRPMAVLEHSLKELITGNDYQENHVFHVVSDHMKSKTFWQDLHERLCRIKNWNQVVDTENMDAVSYRQLVMDELAQHHVIVNFWYFPDAVPPEDMALMLAQYPHPKTAGYTKAVEEGTNKTFNEWLEDSPGGNGEILIIHDPT